MAYTCHLSWYRITVGSLTETIGCAASGFGEISGPLDDHAKEPGSELSDFGLSDFTAEPPVRSSAPDDGTATPQTPNSPRISPLTNTRVRGILTTCPSQEGAPGAS
ncbi:hypothetical protein GCM10023080_091990 [Streptomyces pseudoechinosporeus]